MKNRIPTIIKHSLPVCGAFVAAATVCASTDYGPAIWNPLPNYYTSGNGHKFHVIHDMEGFYGSVHGVLQGNGTSVHYAVNSGSGTSGVANNRTYTDTDGEPAGEVSQFVRDSQYAIHARCWNTHSTGTEHEGFASNPAWYTEAQYVASAGVTKHLQAVFGWAKDRNHIVGHGEEQNSAWVTYAAANLGIDPNCNTHTDPGPYWDWNHYMSLVNGTPPPPTADSDASAMAVDAAGNIWWAAVKTDGTLCTRRYDAATNAWNSISTHGTGWSKFASPALASVGNGDMRLVAVKADGTLWGTYWESVGGWHPWSQHGTGGWATDCGPVMIRQSNGNLTYAMFKQTRELFHRTYDPVANAWGAFGQHLGPGDEASNWNNTASPCLIAGTDGKMWLFAIDALGGLHHKSWTASDGWTGLYDDGAGFSIRSGISGAARPNGDITIAAIKADGDLYTHSLAGGNWSGWSQHSTAWSANSTPSITCATDGTVWMLATKADGSLYHTSYTTSGGWTTWYEESTAWSAATGPTVCPRTDVAGGITFICTKASGDLYTKSFTGAWGSFNLQASGFVK